MLVLSRKTSQQVIIDGSIRVTVVGIEGGRVRLGIDAPPEVPVVRAELIERDALPVVAGSAARAARGPVADDCTS